MVKNIKIIEMQHQLAPKVLSYFLRHSESIQIFRTHKTSYRLPLSHLSPIIFLTNFINPLLKSFS